MSEQATVRFFFLSFFFWSYNHYRLYDTWRHRVFLPPPLNSCGFTAPKLQSKLHVGV